MTQNLSANLYIINEASEGAVYGIGTYIRELTNALRNSRLNVCVINLKSGKPQIHFEEIEGVRYWYFPKPLQTNEVLDHKRKAELYYRNVVYLLQLHIEDRKNLIFHLNYIDSKPLVDSLKNTFDCKIVLVVHYLEPVLILSGNISRLCRIISQPGEPTNEEDIFVENAFLKEKEVFQIADKIICLSNHTYNMLCMDYQLDTKKIAVIPNGLSTIDNGEWTIDNEGCID